MLRQGKKEKKKKVVCPSACREEETLRRRILANYAPDALFVLDLVFLEQIVGVGLGGRLGVGVVEQVLDAQKNLLDRDGRLPGLFLVENRQADGARGVDVGMEQRRDKFACQYS